MRIILKTTEITAGSIASRKATDAEIAEVVALLKGGALMVEVPMRPGKLPGVIVPVGATVQGCTVGPLRMSLWIKAPGAGPSGTVL